jgi:hypothetical protein
MRVEVGPGTLVEGTAPGGPVLQLVYRDESGRELVLRQQRLPEPPATLEAGTLIVEPSGLRSYRWFDRDYVLRLTGPVGADSLRALKDRVR